MIITPKMINDSIILLERNPDGSNANRQARERAKKIINIHADNLQAWISKSNNKAGSAYQTVKTQIFELRRIER